MLFRSDEFALNEDFENKCSVYDESITNLNTSVIENNEAIDELINGLSNLSSALVTHNHDELYWKIDHTHDYNSLTNIPESFTPSEHNHDSLYSKLDHTHTTFNNRLTVNSYRFDLLSKGHYTYLNKIGRASCRERVCLYV